MNQSSKSYVYAAIRVDSPADDGWPEDAGLWPLCGSTSNPAAISGISSRTAGRPANNRRLRSFLQRLSTAIVATGPDANN